MDLYAAPVKTVRPDAVAGGWPGAWTYAWTYADATADRDGRARRLPDAVRRLTRLKAGAAPRPTSHPSRDAKLARI